MTLANAHSLFEGLKSQPSFKRKIHIQAGDSEDKLLRSTDNEIRQHLRRAFQNIGDFLNNNTGRTLRVHGRDSLSIQKSAGVRQIDVKFLRQGSFAYRTLVRPAQPPQQEVDLDDGVYLPVEFAGGQPVFPSAVFFYVVENALAPLLSAHRDWRLVQRPTCVRIVIGSSGAHIDLPLFAVDQDEFDRVQKNFYDAFGNDANKAVKLDDASLPDRDKIYRVPTNRILLAHRDDDWIPSDPKAFQDWFEGWVTDGKLGAVCRRICMYIKGWRDHNFEDSDLSSMAIMISTVHALGAIDGYPADDRDDELTLISMKRLAADLSAGRIIHPISGDNLLDAIDPEDMPALLSQLGNSIQSLNSALNRTSHTGLVVDSLRKTFGCRFPNAPDAVKIDRPSQSSSSNERKAARVPHPNVISSTSG